MIDLIVVATVIAAVARLTGRPFFKSILIVFFISFALTQTGLAPILVSALVSLVVTMLMVRRKHRRKDEGTSSTKKQDEGARSTARTVLPDRPQATVPRPKQIIRMVPTDSPPKQPPNES